MPAYKATPSGQQHKQQATSNKRPDSMIVQRGRSRRWLVAKVCAIRQAAMSAFKWKRKMGQQTVEKAACIKEIQAHKLRS